MSGMLVSTFDIARQNCYRGILNIYKLKAKQRGFNQNVE